MVFSTNPKMNAVDDDGTNGGNGQEIKYLSKEGFAWLIRGAKEKLS